MEKVEREPLKKDTPLIVTDDIFALVQTLDNLRQAIQSLSGKLK